MTPDPEHVRDDPIAGHVPAPEGEEHDADGHDAPDGGHGGKHKGGHDHGGGHGGHGGGWLMTYCDMITLLMTFFICLLTFSANETGKNGMPRKRDSVIYGKGGSGVLFERKSTLDRESVVWRRLPGHYQLHAPGSEIPPMFSDPSLESTGEVLKLLDAAVPGDLKDDYQMRVTAMWFEPPAKLSPSGVQVLSALAGRLRNLPYSVNAEVEDPADLNKALAIVEHLAKKCGLAPDRLAVGVRPRPAAGNNVWLVLQRNR